MNRDSAYTDLLKRHRAMVWRMCWVSAHGDYDRCCDLLQEVCIVLWRHFDGLRPDATPQEERAWVRWWTRSALDLMRRRQRPAPLELSDHLASDLAADDHLAQQELMDCIMASLSPDEQHMMQLRMEGYKANEIASIMGLNRDAVYQRIHRAVAKARRAVLLLFLLLILSTVAIAVVPAWRKAVFGAAGEPESPPADSIAAPFIEPRDNGPAPAEEACATASPTSQEVIRIPEADVPTVIAHMAQVAPAVDSAPAVAGSLPPRPVVSVSGNRIVVSGIYGERVTLRNASGTKLASQVCNGICVFTVNAFQVSSYYQLQIGNRPPIEFEM